MTGDLDLVRQRLESWKAGHLSAESALAHICGCAGVAAPDPAPKDWALDACLRDIDRLQKECATACLQLLDRAFIGTTEEGFADLIQGKTDHQVVSLVIGHHRFPLDTCSKCGRPAPCKQEEGQTPVCSWGCPE